MNYKLRALILAWCLAYAAAAAAGQRSLEVIDLSSTPAAEEVSKARAAFQNGQAIVRTVGGSTANFSQELGARIGAFKAFTQTTLNPEAYLGAKSRSELKLQAVATYIDGDGIERSMISFSPDGRDGRKHMDEWVTHEQSRASGALLGDPQPPAQAWTLLYTITVYASDGWGSEQSTDSVYRLNTISSASDYYMVYTVPQTTPNYDGTCNGSNCGSHTVQRNFYINGNGAALVDHGPTGTISNTTNGFSIGASVGPTGPSVNAGFSTTWNQPDVTTTDHSDSGNGAWQETFSFTGTRCNPVINTISNVSTGTFLSRQGAIFQVPGNTSKVNLHTTSQSLFCSFNLEYINGYYDWLTLERDFLLSPPVLQTFPNSLTVPAGASRPLLVSAYVPNSDQGLVWQITSNQSWLSVPSSGPFSIGQAIPVRVASGTPDGSSGTLSINTSPPFAAPSVVTGPILVNVTVGPSKATPAAGILLFGGTGAPDAAEFYNLAAKVNLPVTPKLPRPLYSTVTRLNTGNILIVGGLTNADNIPQAFPMTATAELFNPNSLTFSDTGSLTTARAAHTATLLPDGKVLIVGGFDANENMLQSAELYDPATGTFSSAGHLTAGRGYHSASLISGPGKPTQVIIYGGISTNRDGWELWDEAQNAFITTGTMQGPAQDIPQPAALANGVLDLVGGRNDSAEIIAQEQLLNPDGPSFQVSQFNLNVPRVFHTLTALLNGAGLLVTGGLNRTGYLASAEIRDSEGWHLLSGTASCPGSPGCMAAARSGHTATLLPDGTVLLVGGNANGTEFYDPASKTFTPGPDIRSRFGHTATLVVTTDTSLVATPSPSAFGGTVKLAASVTSGFGTPTGSVRFLDGSTELGTAELVQGQASIETATLSIGSHALTAVYVGDGISSGSVSPVVTQVVGGTPTTTSLSLSPNPAQIGSVVLMTASVAGTGGPVTGTVVFSDSGQQIASVALTDGSATARVSNLGVGQHSITATYSGNGNWQGSNSATVVETVTAVKLSTTTTLSSNSNPSTSGQPVTFQIQVQPVSGTGAPTGTVNFLDGSTSLGSANLVSGTASFITSSLAEGTHALVATYLGDDNFSASVSSVLTQTVSSSGGGKVTPTVDLTVNGSTSGTVSTGDTVTFAARIHATPGYPAPTGSITVSDSTNSSNRYGSANISKDPNSNDGIATFTNSALAAGSYTLIATYGGDNQGKYYNGVQSNTVSLTVNPRVGQPPPQSSLAIDAMTGARNGTLLLVSLTVTNNGTVPASGITLNQIALRTLAGTGEAALLAPTVPVVVGDLQAGASAVLTLELNVPMTVHKLALSENGTFQDAGGTAHQFSLGQAVFP